MTIRREPATSVGLDPEQTGVGSVFVSNYPPYSFWTPDVAEQVPDLLDTAPANGVALGQYVHIPFCRKRCKFCYFRVYTDKNSKDVERYIDAVVKEIRLYAERPGVRGRKPSFIYFGGGTPSFISGRHLVRLVDDMKAALTWDGVHEVTFECEPGTLTQPKLETIREIGVTRLSLGVENFDDHILQENGRAHVSKEIYRVAPWIRELDFPQVNIDLIAGMVGESWDTWKDSVRKSIEFAPDSVTIYQMELPFNTVYSGQLLDGTGQPAIADWATKREWHDYAISELESAGYEIGSGYTMVRRGKSVPFVYRDSVWEGCDLIGSGVSSFSHFGGMHFQNLSNWDRYLESVDAGTFPVDRGMLPTPDERLTREMILQLKRGRIHAEYFRKKFSEEILERYAPAFERLAERGMLTIEGEEVRLTRKGLLRVDSLLPEFYAKKYQNARYT